MQQKNNSSNPNNPNQTDQRGRVGVADPTESQGTQAKPVSQPSASDDARQMLDEIAGLGHDYRANRKSGPDLATILKAIALAPVTLFRAIIHLITLPFRKADFRLAGEMRKFLKHPGHFFWFNRIAPDRAAEHFGTSSTDEMTHHARRYGSHAAMLLLALVVVFFGGFSGIATKLMSAYAALPSNSGMDPNTVIVEKGSEVYASAIAAGSTVFTKRMQVVVAKDGDTLKSLASNYNISLDTLMWANGIVDSQAAITPGQKIVVPPTTGMLHITDQGDTIGKIAAKYGVDPQVIIGYKLNDLEGDDANTVLNPLLEIMVPGGHMPLRTDLYMYTVKSGDTIQNIADRFGLKPQTLTDNNDLDAGLAIGQQIRILPVDAILYVVKKGDTLNGIANYLSTSAQNIINFTPNNVAANVPLAEGANLVVPGGAWPPPPPPPTEAPPTPRPTPKPAANAAAAPRNSSNPAVAALPNHSPTQAPRAGSAKSAPQPAPPAAPKSISESGGSKSSGSGVGTGTFIWPIHGIITTYFHEPIWYGIHEGIDIATKCGTPTVASDSGTVVLSRYDGGYGNSVVIDHGGGFKTRYGHFVSLPPVAVGQHVAQGQLIGYEGTTGASTGCHVHFEVLVNGAYTDPLRWLH